MTTVLGEDRVPDWLDRGRSTRDGVALDEARPASQRRRAGRGRRRSPTASSSRDVTTSASGRRPDGPRRGARAARRRGRRRARGGSTARRSSCTLEPCPMCAGAGVGPPVATVVFGAADPKAGAAGSLYNLGADQRLNHDVEVAAGVRADECAALLRDVLRRSAGPIDRGEAGAGSPRRSSPEGCRSGRTGRSRKPLWPARVTVGSNPTPSATRLDVG